MGHLKKHLTLMQPEYFSKVLCPFGSATPCIFFDLLQPSRCNLYDIMCKPHECLPEYATATEKAIPASKSSPAHKLYLLMSTCVIFTPSAGSCCFLQHPGAVQQQLCDTLSTVLAPPAHLASHRLFSALLVGFVVVTRVTSLRWGL